MSESARPHDVWKNPKAGAPTGRSRPGGPSGPRRPRRWLVAGLVVAALGGAIAGLLVYLWPTPPPVVLALPVTDYKNPDWPPDPLAEADARAFLERAGGEGAQAFQAQEKGTMVRELDRLARETRDRPVVVLITALGVTEGGKVYLIPGDGQPEEMGTWLALDDVLSPLRRATASRLLILDVRPAADPRSVLTGEDVNEALDAALTAREKAGDLPFFVLSANNPPDGANELRALRRTAFGLALAQGTGGEADGWNDDRKRDGRVSVRELAAYVRELTHHASTAARLTPQLPKLYGTAPDFDAFVVPRGGPPALPTPADLDPYPDFLRDAWKDRDAWLADGLHRRAPRVVRHFTLATIRAERRWLAGGNTVGISRAFDPPASRLRELVGPGGGFGRVVPPARSVARARQKPGVDPGAARTVLQPVFNLLTDPPGPDRDKALAKAVTQVGNTPFVDDALDAAAVAIFSFARNLQQPTAEQMTQLAALVAGIKPRPPRHAELVTIALIGGLLPDHTEKWPPQTVRIVLEVAALAEEATAVEGTVLPWVKDDLARADETRRAAVRTLCDPKAREKARVEAVETLEAVRTDYTSVRAVALALTRAREELEETRAVLIDLADAFPFDSPDVDRIAAQRWTDLTKDFSGVQKFLTPPPGPEAGAVRIDPGEVGRAADNLHAHREQLRGFLRIPETAGVRQLESLLRWPGWDQPDRARLFAKLGQADRRAAHDVVNGWFREPPGREAEPRPRGAGPGPQVARLLERKLAVLQRAGGKSAGDLEKELTGLGANPPAPAVAALARKVRRAGRRELADAYAVADPAAQAEMGWAVDPDDVSAFPSGTPGTPNPEPAARRAAEREFSRWLDRTRYSEDARSLRESPGKAVPETADWYREIGQAYVDSFR